MTQKASEHPTAVDEEYLELIAATAEGDQASFARLYELTSPKLFGIGLRMMRSRDEAEDVVQEVYVKVWNKAHLYDPARGAVMAWMITILRRCALDRLRASPSQRHEVGIDDSLDAPELAIEVDPADDAEKRRVHRCLQALDENKRRAVVLAFFYGLTHEELASRLETPVGTVKSWIRRGLKSLKECLES